MDSVLALGDMVEHGKAVCCIHRFVYIETYFIDKCVCVCTISEINC